jgi:hypothetical protein
MKTDMIQKDLAKIGPDFHLANIALAVLLRKNQAIRHGVVPIHFRERYGGEPNVPITKFGEKALELKRQLKHLTSHAG